MRTIAIGRGAAVLVSAVTFAVLFVNDSWRSDNMFLVPDLAVCTLLLVTAALPSPYAGPGLSLVYAMGSGVFLVSAFDYVVRGEPRVGNFLWTALCAALAMLMARTAMPSRISCWNSSGSPPG